MNAVLANEARMLDVLEQVVPFRSWKGEESELADWLADRAAEWGGEAEVMEIAPGRRQLNVRFRSGKPGRTLVFNGHLDIDPMAGGYKRDPWTMIREGDRIYGAGVFNMRSGLAAMIEASQILRDQGGLPAGELVLSFVAGELQGGVGAKALLEQYGASIGDAVIVTEPLGSRNVITAHAGGTKIGIVVHGRSMHTSRQALGVNAIEKMAKVIDRIRSVQWTYLPRTDLPDLPLMNLGALIGGRGASYALNSSNFQADHCMLIVDVRFMADQNAQSLEADLRVILDEIAAEDSDFSYSIEHNPIQGGEQITRPACDLPPTEPVAALLAEVITRHTGAEPDLVGVHPTMSYGGDDLGHFVEAGVPGVLYGPEGIDGEIGEPDTYSYVSAMNRCAEVLAITAAEFCAGTERP